MSELPKTMREVRRHFPRVIPTKFKKEIEEQARKTIIFCTDKEDRQKAMCTKCGKIILPHKVSHKDTTRCPKCQDKATVIHMWRGVRYSQAIISYHYDKSVIDPNVITCTVIYTNHIYKSDHPWKEKPFQVVDARYVFVPGKGGVMAAESRKIYPEYIVYREGKAPFYRFDLSPHIRAAVTARENIYKKMGSVYEDIYVPSKSDVWEVVKGTGIEYAFKAFEETTLLYDYNRFLKMLEWLCRYPLAMEYLAKIGFDEAIYRHINNGLGVCGVFNMRGKTLDEMTKGHLSKETKAYIYTHDVNLREFQTFQRAQKTKYGKKISLDQIRTLKLDYDGDSIFCFNYVSWDKLKHYLEKQNDKHPNVYMGIGYYWDYLRNCKELGADMSSKATLWPSDLHQTHTNQIQQVKIKKDMAKEEKYQKRKRALIKKYNYENEAMGFVVVVPDSVFDLIREGKDQHICVGTYVNRVADGITNVVYIRKLSEPDAPYGTMEISNDNRIIQVRGKFNKDLPKEAMAFVKKFEKAKLKRSKAA